MTRFLKSLIKKFPQAAETADDTSKSGEIADGSISDLLQNLWVSQPYIRASRYD